MEKLKNQKQLTTEHLDQNKMDCFVLEFLDRLKIMSVYVENINE